MCCSPTQLGELFYFNKGNVDMRSMTGFLAAGLAVCLVAVALHAEDKKAKYTIKEVMQKAMKGGLCKKVASGKASPAEKDELVTLFTALCENKPPKGDEAAWKTRTSALVAAAKSGNGKQLGKAANCATCHKAFKPS